ncbi:Hypothetical protein POVN_LOCUS222 [uncultured virus]|nr:Hypothetical protein POVN_LOCUS222 [uncultured virus]
MGSWKTSYLFTLVYEGEAPDFKIWLSSNQGRGQLTKVLPKDLNLWDCMKNMKQGVPEEKLLALPAQFPAVEAKDPKRLVISTRIAEADSTALKFLSDAIKMCYGNSLLHLHGKLAGTDWLARLHLGEEETKVVTYSRLVE